MDFRSFKDTKPRLLLKIPQNTLKTETSPNYTTNPYDFSNGLQGSGKFTDNNFRSSLRSSLVSPKAFPKPTLNKKPSFSSLSSECHSARSHKPALSSTSSKPFLKPNINKPASSSLKTKENDFSKQVKSFKNLLTVKAVSHQDGVLKEVNRELSSSSKQLQYVAKTSHSSKYYQNTLSTEQNSFASSEFNGGVDINQQLRNIFQAGFDQSSEDSEMDVSVPEEHMLVDFETQPSKSPYGLTVRNIMGTKFLNN